MKGEGGAYGIAAQTFAPTTMAVHGHASRHSAGRFPALLLFWLFLSVALLACGETESPADVEEDPDPISSVTVSPSSLEIDIGASQTVTATVLTQGGADVTGSSTITWSSSAATVASVSGSGASATVTGDAAGSTEVIATVAGISGGADVVVRPDPPTVATTDLPDGEVGVAYSETLAATGGDGTYSWGVSAGALPAGLTLEAATGALSGTPGVEGTFDFTVQVTSAGLGAEQALTLLIAPGSVSPPTRTAVVNVDFMQSVDPTFGDVVYEGDDGIYSTSGGTHWNGADAFTSLTNALDEFGSGTHVDMMENVSGQIFIGAATNELQDNGIVSGDIPENGFHWHGLLEGESYDLAFYVHQQTDLNHWTVFDVTHAGGTTTLNTTGETTWGVPGEAGKDYVLLEGVSPVEISPGQWGFVIDGLNDRGAILGAQLRGPVLAIDG